MVKLDKLFLPKSIAVIGASSHPEKIGFQITNNLMQAGYNGQLFAINPKSEEILGLKTFKSVLDIPVTPDLAVIVIPAIYVVDTLKECAKKGIQSAIVISAGFGEIGESGQKIEKEIVEIANKHGIALLGPNCLGIVNAEINLNATFANGYPKKGHVSMLSQSGAIISSMIDLSKSTSLGFSKIISLGNMAVLSEADLLEYLYKDEETKVIACYFERINVTPKLSQVLCKYSNKKPTIILFGGKSEFGAKAAASHTGSVVSSYLATKTYLKQAGIIMADNLEDLLLYAEAFSAYPKADGKRVAIITNAGGPGIAASDAIHAAGLSMAQFSDQTTDKLSSFFRKEANIKNPVDILGDASEIDYDKALSIVSSDKNVDGIIVLLTPQTATKIEESAKVIANYQGIKPVFAAFVGGEILLSSKKIIENSSKPCFSFPEDAVRSFQTIATFSAIKECQISHKLFFKKSYKEENKEKELLDYKLPILRYIKVETQADLSKSVDTLGFPLVLKTADATAHKSDIGGIALDIKDKDELTVAFHKIGSPAIVGKMIVGKFELLLGVKKYQNIGTSVLFGTGGIYSEIYKDFSYRIAPLTLEMAMEMILETKIGQILNGARNQKKYDLKKLAEIIVNTSRFADDFANISEVDFNPIIVTKDDFHVVDTRIITNDKDINVQ